jgi:hypothetical protein
MNTANTVDTARLNLLLNELRLSHPDCRAIADTSTSQSQTQTPVDTLDSKALI